MSEAPPCMHGAIEPREVDTRVHTATPDGPVISRFIVVEFICLECGRPLRVYDHLGTLSYSVMIAVYE